MGRTGFVSAGKFGTKNDASNDVVRYRNFLKGNKWEPKKGSENHIVRPEGSLYSLGTGQDRVYACRGRQDASFDIRHDTPSSVRVGRF